MKIIPGSAIELALLKHFPGKKQKNAELK